jgi:hypothetical protein
VQYGSQVIRTHPQQPSSMDAIVACVQACMDCAVACGSCADACLAEEKVAELRECIRLNLDCGDVCAATGAVISRLTRPHKAPMKALLQACIEACRTCGEECASHASMHAHCKACAEACRACEQACAGLLRAVP